MKIKLLKPRECLLDEWCVGTVIEVYWDEPNECWRECCKEDPAAFFEDWWEEGFFEFIEERPTTKQASTYNAKDNTKTPTVNNIICFTKTHKDLEISFESGKVTVRDWVGGGDPVEYVVEDAEELKELVDTLESLNEFKTKG